MGNNLVKILSDYNRLDHISDIVRFRDDIRKFKEKNWKLIESFYDDADGRYHHKKNTLKTYRRFMPKSDSQDDRRNVGLFSTAVCLETLIQYQAEIARNSGEYSFFEPEYSRDFFLFIVRGISRRLFSENDSDCSREPVTQPGLLSKINILIRFAPYYKQTVRELKSDQEIQTETYYLKRTLIEILIEFDTTVLENIENSHPYIVFKFLQMIDAWGPFLFNVLKEIFDNEFFFMFKNPEDPKLIASISSDSCADDQSDYIRKKYQEFEESWEDISPDEKTNLEKLKKALDFSYPESGSRLPVELPVLKKVFLGIEQADQFKDYCFSEVYLHAKYELYRQMALKLSGDMTLFDVKRLIYSLLIVYVDDKFSNSLVREKALSLIFEIQKSEPNALWPTGQLLHISKDSSDSITTVECAYDLLEGTEERELLRSVSAFLPELKTIFHNVMRSAQVKQDKDKTVWGWYSLTQRDKTPTSWTSALTLLFTKQFCRLVSIEILKRAQTYFIANYRVPNISWDDIYDSTAVKSKLRLMFDIKASEKIDDPVAINEKTAMFFGPPGTGKTTLARALSAKLGWRYLELTPGDFYAGGESEILPKINDIFYHLQLLKRTIVFIDEIDDLVISRDKIGYDPRTLYVNTLLPRFQDIHDNGDIILIASTNHIEKVDRAISRLGRFDLIIPIGTMSVHGRIDFFTRAFLISHIIKNGITISKKELFSIVKRFVESTKNYTYSQIKIFIAELIKIAQAKNLLNPPIEDEIKLVKTLLGFEEHKFKFNAATKSALIKKKIEGKENLSEIKIRPFSLHDLDDVNVSSYETREGVNIEGIDNQKEIKLEYIIKLYYYLYRIEHGKEIPGSLGLNLNNNSACDEAKKILRLLCQKSEKFNNHYYSIATPFYDTLERICRKEGTYAFKTLNPEFRKINRMIRCRTIS